MPIISYLNRALSLVNVWIPGMWLSEHILHRPYSAFDTLFLSLLYTLDCTYISISIQILSVSSPIMTSAEDLTLTHASLVQEHWKKNNHGISKRQNTRVTWSRQITQQSGNTNLDFKHLTVYITYLLFIFNGLYAFNLLNETSYYMYINKLLLVSFSRLN